MYDELLALVIIYQLRQVKTALFYLPFFYIHRSCIQRLLLSALDSD